MVRRPIGRRRVDRSVIPWCRSTRSAYSDCALSLIIRWICSDADRWFVMVTPRIFSTFSRDMSGSGCGSVSAILRLEFWNAISLLLETFTCSPFCNVVHLLLARAGVDWWDKIAYVSSANFTNELPGCNGFRSGLHWYYTAQLATAHNNTAQFSQQLRVVQVAIGECLRCTAFYSLWTGSSKGSHVTGGGYSTDNCLEPKIAYARATCKTVGTLDLNNFGTGGARKLAFLLEVVLSGSFLQQQGLGDRGKLTEILRGQNPENGKFRRL